MEGGGGRVKFGASLPRTDKQDYMTPDPKRTEPLIQEREKKRGVRERAEKKKKRVSDERRERDSG